MREEESSKSTRHVGLRHDRGRELKGLRGREELRERGRDTVEMRLRRKRY